MSLLGYHQLARTCKRKEIKNGFLETGCDDGNKMEQISLNLVAYLILCYTCILYR